MLFQHLSRPPGGRWCRKAVTRGVSYERQVRPRSTPPAPASLARCASAVASRLHTAGAPRATGRWWRSLGRTLRSPSSVTMNDVRLDLPGQQGGRAFVYRHDGADEPVPTIIYFHGGGWVVGDTDTH